MSDNGMKLKEKIVRKSVKELIEEGKQPKFSDVVDRTKDKIKELDIEEKVSRTWIKEVAERMREEGLVELSREMERGNAVWKIKEKNND